jgi:hypothetical protein
MISIIIINGMASVSLEHIDDKTFHSFQGIRKLCCELLDLKDAVENLCGNMHSKFLAFLR